MSFDMTPALRCALMRTCLAPLLLAVLLGNPAAAQRQPAPAPLQGVVTKVIDGDTFTLSLSDGSQRTVRITDLDAPEICQPWGEEAKQALAERVLKQTVRVQPRGTDRWQRLLGRVFVGDLDVGDRLVRDGHAWSAVGRSGRGPLMAEQRMARALSRGVHADPQAVHPADFRQRHGPCLLPEASPAAPPAAPAPSGATTRR